VNSFIHLWQFEGRSWLSTKFSDRALTVQQIAVRNSSYYNMQESKKKVIVYILLDTPFGFCRSSCDQIWSELAFVNVNDIVQRIKE
jgi:hypothetical protein